MTTLVNRTTVMVGGLINPPRYLGSYYEATRILTENDRADLLAMPILYLQRHTIELLLKELLDGAQSVIVMTQQIQQAKRQPIMSYEKKELKGHNLNKLLSNAEAALAALEWPIPIPGLRELVSLCGSIEQGDETRWRYATLKNSKPSMPCGLSAYVELPIYEIQQRLNKIAEEEQIGNSYEDVMKADISSSYYWSLALTEQQLLQEHYSLGIPL